MKPFHQIKSILWAVDPFQDKASAKRVAGWVAAAAKTFSAKVHVVFASPMAALPVSGKAKAAVEYPYLVAAQANLELFAGFTGLKGLSIEVLVKHPRRDLSPEDMILAKAKDLGAGLIIVATHARGLLGRLLVGSFAESLLAKSPIPLFVVSPHSKAQAPNVLKSVLVPTDLSAESVVVCAEAVKLAAKYKMAIALEHAFINEFVPALQADAYLTGEMANLNGKALKESLRVQEALMASWVGKLKKSGAKVSGRVISKPGLVSDLIVASAKREADFVLMSTHKEASAYDLLGSVTKKVLRASPVPVMTVKD
jgi:nucleotide-binding universal stress UspA family protein